MSKKKTSKFLLTFLMSAASFTAVANFDLSLIESEGDDVRRAEISHRFQNDNMGSRYRRNYKELNICTDVKNKMLKAQQAFENASVMVSELNREFDIQSQKVEDKRNQIIQAQDTVSNKKQQQNELKSLKQNKSRLIRENENIISQVISQLPAANEEKSVAQARKNKKCDWRGNLRKSCREAKKRLAKANENLNSLQTQKSLAQTMLDKLFNIDWMKELIA